MADEAALSLALEEQTSFTHVFLRFYRLPAENWSTLDHHRIDFVYRLENIQDDFAEVLRSIGPKPVRPLPVVHKTDGKRFWQTYYTPETYRRARFVFGPQMEQRGYEFPKEWNIEKVQSYSRAVYRVLVLLKNLIRRLRPIHHLPERRP